MKSFIILILLVVVAGGSALSKPSPDDFKAFLKDRATNSQTSLIGQAGAEVFADAYVQECTFKNRIFWETVTKDGKDVYVGCFSHWFGGDEIKDIKQDLKK
jgi:hypothetical protein